MRGHNKCFYEEIWQVILELYRYPFLSEALLCVCVSLQDPKFMLLARPVSD